MDIQCISLSLEFFVRFSRGDLCLVSVHDFKIHIYNTQKLNFEGYWDNTGYKKNYRGMRRVRERRE